VAEIPIERKPRSHVGLILLIVLLIIVAACAYWWWSNQNSTTSATPATGLRAPAAMVVAVRDFYMVGV
jgi:flagellar basal body-associated protein FliL